MTKTINLSRRDVLNVGAGASALLLGFHTGFRGFPVAQAAEGASFEPNVYVRIDKTGLVTIVAHRSEMGTGIRTGLPAVLADELEADWSRVDVVQAPGDPRYGDQNTDGSRSMRQFYQAMRVAGATARQMLESAAARIWNVDSDECKARNHAVVHTPTGRKLAFGRLVSVAATLPVPSEDHISLRFKTPDARRYVGKPMPIVDLHSIVRGEAKYGIDTVVPGMKYASIERCPVYGGKVKSFDAKDALAVAGVEQVVEIPGTPAPSGFNPLGGIAVVASNTWAAQQGREKLKIEWDLGPNSGYDTTAYRAELEATATKPGRVVRTQGDVDEALRTAATRVSASYFVPHLAHAPMEAPAATARVANGKCEAWAPSQNPQGARETVADVLGMPQSNVTIYTTLLGGAFGRKSKHDFIAEAAWLSQKLDAPMKVTWTREDDIQHDYYHTICAQHLEAGLDGNGRATAWLHRTVFPPIEATFQPDVTYGTPGELQQGATDMPYAISNVRCENGPAANHVRIGWYRSVFNIPHAFAVCSFADELAAAARKDPVEHLRELIGPARHIDLKALGVDYPNYGASLDEYPVDTGRLRATLDVAVENSAWSQPLPPRQGRGVAVHRSFLTYVAVVVHVAVDNDGTIKVLRIDMAVDCGLVVNPDRVRAQMEGAAIMALGNALYSNITAKAGRVEQSNFGDYLVARTDITPETHVHLIDSNAPPAGAGEPGVPPTAPALCNAIFAATGKRIRSLPIDSSVLKA
jgi:isoquinoline 1-oxidoreductase beta subunit